MPVNPFTAPTRMVPVAGGSAVGSRMRYPVEQEGQKARLAASKANQEEMNLAPCGLNLEPRNLAF
jgi:hypothetical protein